MHGQVCLISRIFIREKTGKLILMFAMGQQRTHRCTKNDVDDLQLRSYIMQNGWGNHLLSVFECCLERQILYHLQRPLLNEQIIMKRRKEKSSSGQQGWINRQHKGTQRAFLKRLDAKKWNNEIIDLGELNVSSPEYFKDRHPYLAYRELFFHLLTCLVFYTLISHS